jgi:hypothetical protein
MSPPILSATQLHKKPRDEVDRKINKSSIRPGGGGTVCGVFLYYILETLKSYILCNLVQHY